MCGLIGLFGKTCSPMITAGLPAALTRMQRRGPDAEGTWQESGVALGHRRLAIIDLDARAAQPMHSACGRYVVVFNGEIYNYRALREELLRQGAALRTESDTEVIVELFAREREAMLGKLQGMFAFVIWDRKAARAFAARDPYGIKPLYYAEAAGGVVFASQVKAIMATGLVSREPCLHGQAGFWMLGSVPEPYTWYRDVKALRAGHCAWVSNGKIERECLWQDIVARWREAETFGVCTVAEAQEQARNALRESVARHIVADVPVGVFLSGGIDSGSLAALMAEMGQGKLQGVTLTYDEFSGKAEDEAPRAAAIAKHYGIEHRVRRVTQAEFLSDLPRILDAMDQPSIDGVNTWYASKAVAEAGLKVVVSGVGGDEIFAGYSHFQTLPRLLTLRKIAAWLPGATSFLQVLGRMQAQRTGNLRWAHFAEWTRTIEGAWWLRRSVHAPEQLPNLMGDELARLALANFDVVACVRAMVGKLPSDPLLAIGQIESATYMRNQLLRDSDWASMDHSVELRTPLVDATLLASLTPVLSATVRMQGKAALAMAPRAPLPRTVLSAAKTGFGIPVARWRVDLLGATRSWQEQVALGAA
jgi:asparagine synthase (glutamine-hydrolysing)